MRSCTRRQVLGVEVVRRDLALEDHEQRESDRPRHDRRHDRSRRPSVDVDRRPSAAWRSRRAGPSVGQVAAPLVGAIAPLRQPERDRPGRVHRGGAVVDRSGRAPPTRRASDRTTSETAMSATSDGRASRRRGRRSRAPRRGREAADPARRTSGARTTCRRPAVPPDSASTGSISASATVIAASTRVRRCTSTTSPAARRRCARHSVALEATDRDRDHHRRQRHDHQQRHRDGGDHRAVGAAPPVDERPEQQDRRAAVRRRTGGVERQLVGRVAADRPSAPTRLTGRRASSAPGGERNTSAKAVGISDSENEIASCAELDVEHDVLEQPEQARRR